MVELCSFSQKVCRAAAIRSGRCSLITEGRADWRVSTEEGVNNGDETRTFE
jgi:hypothetical protein